MDSGRPKILLIIIKNISGLDYAVPLLWRVREARPDAELSVLYCTLSRKQILRESRFYSETLRSCGVAERDLCDYLSGPAGCCAALWRTLLGRSSRDSGGPVLVRRVLRRAERALARRVDVPRILPELDPDVILFDNRSVTAFEGRDALYAYFARARKKVVLLPHAPHHTGTTAFTPFDERGEPLPDYCEFWMPFKFDRSWERLPEKKAQFVYVGYPGLDSAWLARPEFGAARARRAADPLRCLFIIRKFLRPGQSRPPGHDAYVFDYDEFLVYVRCVAAALRAADAPVELVVKPHPSNDFRLLRDVFAESGIARWSITHDSIYGVAPACDLVISLYSTTLLIPAMAGVPTVLLHSRIQDEIHQWDEMKRMYTGLRFYLDDPNALPERFGDVVELARGRRGAGAAPPSPDVAHLRQFFPDGATQRCLERLGL